ncbi:histidine phosphatase family protein [Paenibacillus sp. y28]|uniref:histidine phosphatase family protein n=1 Tax=Paenibacillus sp. y28 TaxID=3129110 RepID=UPI0030194563
MIGFVRHGVTDWNRERRAQGQVDIPLNEEGRRQASMLAKRLAADNHGWDMIISSDLQRASCTADTIAEAIGLPVHRYDMRLRERSHGRLEGTTVEDRVQKWGDAWEAQDHGSEPLEEVQARGISLVEELSHQYPGRRILLVSHGAFISETLRVLLNNQPLEMLQNTSLTVVHRSADAWECSLYNCISHLHEEHSA